MRIGLLILGLLVSCIAAAETKLAPYGEAYTLIVELWGETGQQATGETPTVTCGVGTSLAGACTNTMSEIGSEAAYSLALTSAEMQAAQVRVNIDATIDRLVTIETYGDASALHADIGIAGGSGGAGSLELLSGTCDGASTTTQCNDATNLTQAADYWNNWTAIIVSGQPPRCVRGFDATNDRLSWPTSDALPSTAASQAYTLVAAPECRTFP